MSQGPCEPPRGPSQGIGCYGVPVCPKRGLKLMRCYGVHGSTQKDLIGDKESQGSPSPQTESQGCKYLRTPPPLGIGVPQSPPPPRRL